MKNLLNLFKKNKKITDNAFDPLSDEAEMDPFLDLPDWELYDYVSTVMYIEDTYNPEINEFIRSNIRELTAKYDKQGFYFIYLPYLLESENYKKIWDYNHPYFNASHLNTATQDIYKAIIQQFDLIIDDAALISINYENTECKILSQKSEINADILIPFPKIFDNSPNSICNSQIFNDDLIRINENENVYNKISFKKEEPSEAEIQQRKFEDELMEKIDQLIEKGYLKSIGQIIEKLQNVTVTLSRLFITNDYRIFLKDFGMKEVIMPPLPKSLFMLFLRHPEGIRFKEIANYEDELLSIYRKIATHENPEKIIDSIKAITAPFSNSLNEKTSRIKEAFINIISNDIAKNYCITGPKGELKKISLDRSLVIYQ
ncbi:MAG: hypothetical protein ACOYOV_12050 [Bacteroidales bacterium]